MSTEVIAERAQSETARELDFEFSELEARIAPGLLTACSGCSGCSQPGCDSCGVEQ